MKRPNTAQLITSLKWHRDNDVMTFAESQIIIDAIDLLRDLAFAHIETERGSTGEKA